MRLPVERFRPLHAAAAALSAVALAGCGAGAGSGPAEPSRATPLADRLGPAADYPIVLGAPFVVDGVTYTPADTMNYDQVGYAATGGNGGAGVSLAHRTLPLPSYVEVTSLATGRTILVRAERRGPMSGANLVELSPGAAAQLGIGADGAPVRVRRVNPVEQERALLRAGQRAPDRMDTPMPLANVLMRKLEGSAPPPTAAAIPAPAPSGTPAETAPVLARPVPAKPAPQPATPKPATPVPPPTIEASRITAPPRPAPPRPFAFVVQVGAFADPARATAAARKVAGTVSPVSPAGRLHRVRITGLATSAEASAALAKARAAGYSDARIQRAD